MHIYIAFRNLFPSISRLFSRSNLHQGNSHSNRLSIPTDSSTTKSQRSAKYKSQKMEHTYEARTGLLRQRLRAVAEREISEQNQDGYVNDGRGTDFEGFVPDNTTPTIRCPLDRSPIPSRVFSVTTPITNISAANGSENSSYGVNTCSACDQPYTRAWLETEIDTENKTLKGKKVRLPCNHFVEPSGTMDNWVNGPASPEWTPTPAEAYARDGLFNNFASPTIVEHRSPVDTLVPQRRGAVRRDPDNRVRFAETRSYASAANDQYGRRLLPNTLAYPKTAYLRAENRHGGQLVRASSLNTHQGAVSALRTQTQHQSRFLQNGIINPSSGTPSAPRAGNQHGVQLVRASSLNSRQVVPGHGTQPHLLSPFEVTVRGAGNPLSAHQGIRRAQHQTGFLSNALTNPNSGSSFTPRTYNYQAGPLLESGDFYPSQGNAVVRGPRRMIGSSLLNPH